MQLNRKAPARPARVIEMQAANNGATGIAAPDFAVPKRVSVLGTRDLASPVALVGKRVVTAGAFLAEAAALAERLPAQGRPVNMCGDRHLFAVGTVAALLRGQMSLMPPNSMASTLAELHRADAGVYVIADAQDLDCAGLPTVFVRHLEGLAPLAVQPMVDADIDAVCLLTSGSTGAPQPHRKRWGALQINALGEAERLAAFMGWPSLKGLHIAATVPAQHSYGFESTVLLGMFAGAAFDAGRPFYPADVAETLARLPRPRALVSTPFHLKTLLAAGVALPEVDLVLSATAPLPPQLAAQTEQAMGCRLVEIYGCTEAGQVATRRTTDGDVWTTLGALRIHQHKSADGERTIVQGGHVLEPTPLGDVIELLDAQHFRLCGRASDIIHVGGRRSSLAHLNFQLNRIAGIEDGAFWLPESDGATIARPVAFVVAPRLDARSIIAALRKTLEPVFVPRRVVHVQALPRAATGKLTAAEWQQFAKRALAGGTQ
jgi:acyl-coenzyme A synthetase/AMP-(fatty) acid ligase